MMFRAQALLLRRKGNASLFLFISILFKDPCEKKKKAELIDWLDGWIISHSLGTEYLLMLA